MQVCGLALLSQHTHTHTHNSEEDAIIHAGIGSHQSNLLLIVTAAVIGSVSRARDVRVSRTAHDSRRALAEDCNTPLHLILWTQPYIHGMTIVLVIRCVSWCRIMYGTIHLDTVVVY